MILPCVDILDVRVSAINMAQALATIDDWIERRERQYVCISGVHGVMESQRDPSLKAIHNAAGMVTPDGMPLVWLSQLYGYRHVSRVYGPDLMLAVCGRSVERSYRHYLYGGGAGVPERLAERLERRFPGIRIAGTYSPPFRPLTTDEDSAIVEAINASSADIVWVGLSTPKQERWMHDHRARLEAPVMVGVGAAFDFHAGLKRQAPLWMQKRGLEWSFRLATEPRRLWRRYLQNNPAFVYRVARRAVADAVRPSALDLVGTRTRSVDGAGARTRELSAQERVSIILKVLSGRMSIRRVCRAYGIPELLLQQWVADFLATSDVGEAKRTHVPTE